MTPRLIADQQAFQKPLKPVRVALIGRFDIQLDEGMHKLCAQFHSALRQHHDVRTVQASDFCTGRAWSGLRRFRPQCLHYVTGPSVFSLVALKFHQLTLPGRPTTVATGLRPYLGRMGRALLPLLAPNFYLAQARRWQTLFAKAGSRTVDLANGVDTTRFHPVTPARKVELKARWALPLNKPLVLHVGHVKPSRHLDSLSELQRSGRYQVVIVGSETFSQNGDLRYSLEKAGCRIITEYLPNVEELYQAADFYVFTVRAVQPGEFPSSYDQVGVIDFPLSILEAMACGLPVVTTCHDAVHYFLDGTQGVHYFDGSAEDCVRQLEFLKEAPVKTRDKAEAFDLARVHCQLASFYSSLQSFGAAKG